VPIGSRFPATAVTAVAVLLALGCQSAPVDPAGNEYVWPRSKEEMSRSPHSASVAKIVVSNCETYHLGKCASNFKAAVVAIDGKRISSDRFESAYPSHQSFVEMLPGTHTVDVAVRWSNGTVSVGPLLLDAQADGVYRLFAYEVNDVSELASVNVERRTSTASPSESGLSEFAENALGIVLWAMIWPVPAMALGNLALEIPRGAIEHAYRTAPAGTTGALPFQRCCWYWIEDSNGKVIAGERVRASAVD